MDRQEYVSKMWFSGGGSYIRLPEVRAREVLDMFDMEDCAIAYRGVQRDQRECQLLRTMLMGPTPTIDDVMHSDTRFDIKQFPPYPISGLKQLSFYIKQLDWYRQAHYRSWSTDSIKSTDVGTRIEMAGDFIARIIHDEELDKLYKYATMQEFEPALWELYDSAWERIRRITKTLPKQDSGCLCSSDVMLAALKQVRENLAYLCDLSRRNHDRWVAHERYMTVAQELGLEDLPAFLK